MLFLNSGVTKLHQAKLALFHGLLKPTWICLELHLDCFLAGFTEFSIQAMRCDQKRSFQRNLIPVSSLSLYYCFPIIFITNDSCFQRILFERLLFLPVLIIIITSYFIVKTTADLDAHLVWLTDYDQQSICSNQDSAISIILYRHDILVQ